ncbi:hypothetical protein BH11ACT1_BH11ACT1_14100 [soil metagenome]
MAHIDNLIGSIKDPQLRTALRAEYDKVTKSRRLGLVFDRHLPESVVLPGFAIRDGEKVQVLADDSDDPADLDGSGVWTVTQVGETNTKLRDGNGDSRQVPSTRLVAIREFGDPIYPGLVSTGRVVRGGGTDGGDDDGGKPFHTVINAENYHALEALLFAHEGQVDAIYIDPPYNTGARDWKYNNDYVDDADPYRHSKWLSFIERRLLLAKRLLNPTDSVLIVTIDEKECLRLGMLLEQTFPEARIQMVTSVISSQASVRTGAFSRCDEYIFFVMIGDAGAGASDDDMLNEGQSAQKSQLWFQYVRTGKQNLRQDRPAMFFPLFSDPATGRIVEVGNSIPVDVDKATVMPPAGLVAVWPETADGQEGRWRTGAETARRRAALGLLRLAKTTRRGSGWSAMTVNEGTGTRIAAGEIIVDGYGEDGAAKIREISGGGLRQPKTVWNKTSHNAGWHGSKLLAAFLPGRSFPFPKSLYAVEDALRLFIGDKPNALVVDFFAGSGTTTQAVMRLNHQDEGHRRSICVTNNEVGVAEQVTLRARGFKPGDEEWEALGICDYITKPRIRAAITGTATTGGPVAGNYRFVDEFAMADGFRENAEFFTLTYEEPTLVSLGRRFAAIAPLLWLRAGARGERIAEVAEEGWSIPATAFYGVLFDTSAWGAFVTATTRRDDLTHVFIVTDSLVEYQQIVARLDPTMKTTRLYADYLRSFEINTRTL